MGPLGRHPNHSSVLGVEGHHLTEDRNVQLMNCVPQMSKEAISSNAAKAK